MSDKIEKVYNVMSTSGGWGIALGVFWIVIGVSTGVISIINGASLLKNKSELTF